MNQNPNKKNQADGQKRHGFCYSQKTAPLLPAAYFGVIEELELRSSSSITPR